MGVYSPPEAEHILKMANFFCLHCSKTQNDHNCAQKITYPLPEQLVSTQRSFVFALFPGKVIWVGNSYVQIMMENIISGNEHDIPYC